MSDLYLNVEVYPGASIENAAGQACAAANRWHIDVWFSFNDVRCLARPGDDYRDLVASWNETLKTGYKTASAPRRGRAQRQKDQPK